MARLGNTASSQEILDRLNDDFAANLQGLKGQNIDRQAAGTGTILVDGTAYFQMVTLRKGSVVTNLHCCVTTAGTGTSLSKVGLYDSLGNRLAISADQGTAWNTAGMQSIAVTSPYTVLADGGYYLAVVAKTATTMPTMARGASSASQAAAISGFMAPFGTLAAQTDLPATATIVTTAAIAFWMGWS
jgi:hypothetical protein